MKKLLSYLIKLIIKIKSKDNTLKDRLETKDKVVKLITGKKDARDYVFSSNSVTVIPDKFSIRNLPPVRHQLSIGSCASHAAVAAYEIMMLNKNPRRYLEGSELYHYYNARKHVNHSFPKDAGMTIKDSCKTLKDFNMATEYSCPYDIKKFNDKPSWATYATSGMYKVLRYERVITLEEIKQSILEGIPVVCGIRVYAPYMKLNKSNYIYNSKEGKYYGGHAQTLVSYDNIKKVFTSRNSWGSGFGNKGYCEIPYDFFSKIGFDYWRIILK